ncbi:TPA: MFS transporter [Pseudomonas aeruginosa]|uniref:MFS transporter n=1 Tax=Pseudomonas aeruginosa TaxID=287 RepID=UPI001A1D9D0E|nr:MFS transporter [Pseudomonas aeruginosa]MBH4114815.1 MFS transporter [Pseudomonas aeruginosa]HCF3941575.1 MFS transporter [Pseudomonas aeruginosa]HEK3507687.1 MFS transporter [Pseudomonas aeruginosa]
MSSTLLDKPGKERRQGWLLLAGVLLLAATLRAPITSLGPVLLEVQDALNINASTAGLLHALPLLFFAVISLVAPALGRRLGIAGAIWFALVLISAGTVIRSLPVTSFIWVGTATLSSGIAVCNVLLPGYVKQQFGEKGPSVIGLYVASMAILAGVATGIAVPISQEPGLDWRWSIGCWALPALLALVLWLPQLRGKPQAAPMSSQSKPSVSPWRSGKGWQVALFFAAHSLVFYCVIDWYTAYAASGGVSPGNAGLLLLVYQIVSTAANIITGPMIRRMKSQALMGFVCGVVMLIGACGLLALPSYALLWIVLLGLGAGVSMVMSIALFGLRTQSPDQAARLSGMAQFVGYTGAGVGLMVVGFIHELTSNWEQPLSVMIFASVAVIVFATAAGRNGYIK